MLRQMSVKYRIDQIRYDIMDTVKADLTAATDRPKPVWCKRLAPPQSTSRCLLRYESGHSADLRHRIC
jgi:hypothetical protein